MVPKYYRTFIGLPVLAGSQLIAARDELMEALPGERISWVNPQNYHVTLRFLGDTNAETILLIKETLGGALKLPMVSEFQLKGPASFGPRKKPRVIWMGFEETKAINLFKEELDRALEKVGMDNTDQPFRAHLTLGRVRSLKNPVRYYEIIEKMKATFSGTVKMDRVVFFRSVPGEKGPTYTALKEMRFPA